MQELPEEGRTIQKPGTLLIRADASVQIGAGHVMRCLALAQAWRRGGGAVTFLSSGLPAALLDRLDCEGCAVVTADDAIEKPETTIGVLAAGATHAVLDGYQFGAREEQLLSTGGLQLLLVDDLGRVGTRHAAFVLNHNVCASENLYPDRGPTTKLLLGPNYFLLRREFQRWIPWKREVRERASRVLVAMGGSDPDNMTGRIMQSLSQMADGPLEIVLIVGGSNPHADSLDRQMGSTNMRARVVRDPKDMCELMAWADVAIAGAGVTAHELAFMGLPAILLVLAENQRAVAQRLCSFGAAWNGGTVAAFDSSEFPLSLTRLLRSVESRAAMADHGRELLDGLGADRVCAALCGRALSLRPVQEDDCQLLYRWASDPQVRSASFHSEPIPWEEHQRWFAARLSDPCSVLHLAEDVRRNPIGQVRYQLEGNRATLSLNVDPAVRSQGWGKQLIYFSTRALLRQHGLVCIDAFVKPDNTASRRLFEASGFQMAAGKTEAGKDAVHFTWQVDRIRA